MLESCQEALDWTGDLFSLWEQERRNYPSAKSHPFSSSSSNKVNKVGTVILMLKKKSD